MRHHMAPVAGRVADRQEDQFPFLARFGKSLISPWIPVNRIMGMLEQVGALFIAESVCVQFVGRVCCRINLRKRNNHGDTQEKD